MKMTRRFAPLATLAAALAMPLALAACADPDPLYVDQAWVRPNPNPDAPSAAYFVVHGGEEAVQLRRVTTEGALRTEMHESAMEDGMMKMKPIDAVDIPAKTDVAFKPGGKHVMLFGLNPAVVEAGELQMTMLFSNGDRLIVDAKVNAPAGGEAAPAGNDAAMNMGGDMEN